MPHSGRGSLLCSSRGTDRQIIGGVLGTAEEDADEDHEEDQADHPENPFRPRLAGLLPRCLPLWQHVITRIRGWWGH